MQCSSVKVPAGYRAAFRTHIDSPPNRTRPVDGDYDDQHNNYPMSVQEGDSSMKEKEMKDLQPMSEAQREIMEFVWQKGEAGVGQIYRAISARRPVVRNTVLTTVMRLAEKGWLVGTRDGNAFRYTPAFPKERAQAEEVRRLVDTIFDGSAEGLVMTLLEQGGLTAGETKRIRAMILAAGRKGKKGKL
jgi:BlaI family transcriptional regulator, penicillinase repressor